MFQSFTSAELDHFHKMLMSSCDLDGDGKICEEELTMMLLGIQKLQKQVQDEFGNDLGSSWVSLPSPPSTLWTPIRRRFATY